MIMLVLPIVASAIDIKKYQVKSGIIEYKIEGTINGTETVYFDDYGIKEARLTKTVVKIFGISNETETLTITDKEWNYNIDLKEKTGTKMKNEQMKQMLDGLTQKEYEEFGKKMMTEMGGKLVGNESILGYNCEVWDVSKISSKTWNYKYVPLKTEVNMMGATTYLATSFKENVSIPADKFQVPKGIKVTEQEMPEGEMDMFKMMQKAMEGEEEK